MKDQAFQNRTTSLQKVITSVSHYPELVSRFFIQAFQQKNSRNTFHNSVRDLKTGRIIDLRNFQESNTQRLWM